MLFELFLGIRYLKAKRKQAFISVISIISVVGVMVGVMALIVVLSVMNGFREDLMSKILGVNSHVLILSYEGAFGGYDKVARAADRVDGVIATTPFIYSQVMVESMGNVSGAVLRGLDTRTASGVINIKPMIKKGPLSSLDSLHKGLPAIIIGSELARQIGVQPGSVLTVVSPYGKLTPLGRVPRSRKYTVTALFDSGMYEYDSSMVYVSLKEAQDFLGLGRRVTGIEVRVKDIYKADQIGKSINKKLGYPFWTKDWKLMNRSLVSALRLEKITMFVILTMIVLVGALNIVSTLVMVVMEKTKDVAILRAMGATAKSIMAIFVFQGLVVGVVGTIAGLASGLGLCHLLAKYKFIKLPSDVYYISTLPVRVETQDIVFVTVAAVMISFLATIYPSWHASRLNPVEALRYE
ncbi:MAG: lipoprotein-releasing ABC transporter permease subunit [Deltaproteobacteria bacterium]|nr:lipoprotein-releasing ABC transporter permease subunit [Deltaproteobacteria bacterium]MBW1919092.1 lipoprotein-releasing ABC transporter permease subunit [Deltaproteobacteria bacterium]MBW1935907.1 lipoprotein-releasing ABC transporter permease subunit [Deltaproteobacteria bacterium]MBW1977804.1 lipoprotein-releasing ABC transporter permease subunit [Deltaproteobacteria bacterium]MBW2044386.1 lipoprotein-releasing ABC transporter permease subunit [Deltaproteobacteria bacterium]